jgi:glycosyltransferase involved in cell wall biosynthesis
VTSVPASNQLERKAFAPSMVWNRSVAVVITTYNHAQFLADAIPSVLTQKHPVNELNVIDDGSTDDPGSVVAQYSGVRLIRQTNRGLAGTRNAGLEAAASEAIVFLDADDWLLPEAIEEGLACFERNPQSGLVYGGHRRTDANWKPIGGDSYTPINAAFTDLLQGNLTGNACMYWRKRLEEIGGFDMVLRRCGDYDVYSEWPKSIQLHLTRASSWNIEFTAETCLRTRARCCYVGRSKCMAGKSISLSRIRGAQRLGAEDDLSGESITATKLC